MSLQLSAQEREALRAMQRRTREVEVCKRLAVLLGLDAGLGYAQLSALLGLEESTLRRYEAAWGAKGMGSVRAPDYARHLGKLDAAQLKRLGAELEERLYFSAAQVGAWVQEHLGVSYHAQGLVRVLHRLGFVWKQTKAVPAKADVERQRRFAQGLHLLKANLQEDEALLFMDAAHPEHRPFGAGARGWIRRGRDWLVGIGCGRRRVGLHGVAEPASGRTLVLQQETVTSASTIALLEEVQAAWPGKATLYVVADNASYYRSQELTAWLAGSRVELIALPAFSPNLNLIERLWALPRREGLLRAFHYEHYAEFCTALCDWAEGLAGRLHELRRLLAFEFHFPCAQAPA